MLKEAVSTFTFSTVVSLTGSNPMDLSVMRSLQSLKNAIFIYLDVHLDDIVKRLGEMKVDRIVGASDACCGTSNPALGLSTPLRELVDRRAVHYDPWFDVRVWPKEGATLEGMKIDLEFTPNFMLQLFIVTTQKICRKGASIKDVHTFLAIFDPPFLPCLQSTLSKTPPP